MHCLQSVNSIELACSSAVCHFYILKNISGCLGKSCSHRQVINKSVLQPTTRQHLQYWVESHIVGTFLWHYRDLTNYLRADIVL